jgi:hypothetical protein
MSKLNFGQVLKLCLIPAQQWCWHIKLVPWFFLITLLKSHNQLLNCFLFDHPSLPPSTPIPTPTPTPTPNLDFLNLTRRKEGMEFRLPFEEVLSPLGMRLIDRADIRTWIIIYWLKQQQQKSSRVWIICFSGQICQGFQGPQTIQIKVYFLFNLKNKKWKKWKK